MASIIVIGAGVGGLSTAMLLALDGHDVTVLERDPQPPPATADEAWESWQRRGVNQFRLPHFLLARWRELAERELPDVMSELEGRGGVRWRLEDALPHEVTGDGREGDDRFASLTGRRPALESAVATAADRTYGLTVRRGVAIEGLLTGEPMSDVPHVAGVRTEAGDELRADLVVDSSGRRSPLPKWLESIGARTPIEEREDSGFVYYARHFRARDGHVPRGEDLLLQHYESVSILTLPADNDTWSAAFITSSRDRALSGLRDADTWTRAFRRYSLAAHWLDGEPLTGVDVMAKIEDRYRRFVVEGAPVATGIVAVGDAWACTNPSLGRGISLALLHGTQLRDLLRETDPSEPEKLVVRWDEVTEERLTPYYQATVTYDRHRLGEIEAACEGRPYETEDPTWAITRAFSVASRKDPDLLRHFLEVVNVLALPEEVLARPGVLESVLELGGDGSEPALLEGPDRAGLLASIAGS